MAVAVPGLRNVTVVTVTSLPDILYKPSCTTLTVPLTLTLPTGLETKPTKTPSQPVMSRHTGNRRVNIKRKGEDMA